MAGITLGSARRFLFQCKKRTGPGDTGPREVTTLYPSSGSMYVMQFPTNHNFKHAIPAAKRDELVGPRISMTFRRMKVPQP